MIAPRGAPLHTVAHRASLLGAGLARVLDLARRSAFGRHAVDSRFVDAPPPRAHCAPAATFERAGAPRALGAVAATATLADAAGSLGPGLPRGDYSGVDLSAVPVGNTMDLALTQTVLETGDTWIARHVMRLTDYMHTSLGLEWWAAIVGTTLVARALTAPLYFMGIRTGARMMEHQPGLLVILKRMQGAQAAGDREAMMQAATERVDYVRKHKIQFWRMMMPLLVQMPLFVGYFGAMRQFSREAHLWDGFVTGGTAWFPLLHLPDPLGIAGCGLPVLSAALSLASVLLNNNLQGMPQAGLSVGGQRVLFGSMTTLFSLATTVLPTSAQLYIATTSATMLVQQGLLRMKWSQRLLGMPDNWPPTGERLAEMQRRRDGMAGPMGSGMNAFKPLFAVFTNVASNMEAAWVRRSIMPLLRNPLQSQPGADRRYVTMMGLRDPGPPPPPPLPPAAMVVDAAAASGGDASAASRGAATSCQHAALEAAGGGASSAAAAATAGAAGATAAAPLRLASGALHTQKPASRRPPRK